MPEWLDLCLKWELRSEALDGAAGGVYGCRLNRGFMRSAFTARLHFPDSKYPSGSHMEFEFSELGMVVRAGHSKRVMFEAGKPGWTGHGGSNHALSWLFQDEGVKGHKVIESLVERVWSGWVKPLGSDDDARSSALARLDELLAWVNRGAKGERPAGGFWGSTLTVGG